MNISVVISAYNEEKMIKGCLDSVKDLADEIIIIDNSSMDKTIEIVKKFKTEIFSKPNDPVMLNKNKNFGFNKTKGKWIISLDADERLTPELANEIKSSIKNKIFNGYEIPRKNIIFGKWIKHSIWWPDYNLRLFKKGYGEFPQKHVHEKLEVKGKIGKLKNPMVHYNYQTVAQYVKKMNATYTESEAEYYIKLGKNIYWYDAIRWPISDFLKTFFAQRGYKDGFHGLILSMLQASYSLIFFAKVWEKKEKFKDLTPNNFLIEIIAELSKAAKDIKYWVYETLSQEFPAKKIYYKIRKKLK